MHAAVLEEYELNKNLLETEVVNEIKDKIYKYCLIKTGYDKIVENNSNNSDLCARVLEGYY